MICLQWFKFSFYGTQTITLKRYFFCLHFILRILGVITFFLVPRFHFGIFINFFFAPHIHHTIKCVWKKNAIFFSVNFFSAMIWILIQMTFTHTNFNMRTLLIEFAWRILLLLLALFPWIHLFFFSLSSFRMLRCRKTFFFTYKFLCVELQIKRCFFRCTKRFVFFFFSFC